MVDLVYSDGSPVLDENLPEDMIKKKQTRQLSYHVDKRMMRFLDSIKKKITQSDKDYVLIIDGYEGSGKSTLAQQIGRYVDPTLNLDRICMTADEWKEQINKAGKGQCVIYDEAVTGMSAGDSIARIGKILKSMMMQMRQKNLFVILIIPTVFELNKYAVLSRARCLFHTYENKGRAGYWVGYNKKDLKKLYLSGKKTYTYRVKSRFIGRFYGKYVVNEEAYRKKKSDALELVDDTDKPSGRMYDKAVTNEKALVNWLIDLKYSYRDIVKEVKARGGSLSIGQISRYRGSNVENAENV